MKQPKIIFAQDSQNDWYWTSVSPNGKILAKSSESYGRLQKAKEGFNADTKERLRLLGIPVPKVVENLGGDFLSTIPDNRKIFIRNK